MGKKVRDTRVYQIPYNTIGNLMGSAQFAQSLAYKLRDSGPTQNGYQFRFSHDITLMSYGEYITIWLTPTGPSTTQVEVESACVMPTQIFDWGTNKKNIEALWRYLDGTLVQPMQQPVQQPVQQSYVQPVQQYAQPVQQTYAAAPQGNFCNQCGNPVPAGSRFCGRCGSQLG